jgi:transposase
MSLPSKYRPELCDEIIPYFKDGMSITEICLELNMDRSSFYDYIKDYPEFAKAVARGKAFAEGWWESMARKNLKSKKFNAPLWHMNMKNRYGWRDRQELSDKVESLIEKVIDKL